MYNIATLNKISPVGLANLTDDYQIVEDIDSANGILVRSQGMHDMEFSENLLAIGRAGAGVNNIPLDKCAEEGIVVFNTPGANANAVKELVLAGLFLSSRNIPKALPWAAGLTDPENVAPYENVSKAVEKGKGQFAGREIKGKTLGVIGLGAIGVLVANAADALGMKVIGYDPYFNVKAALKLTNNATVEDDLEALVPQCDYLTIHVPAMASTNGMINAELISKMKDGAIFLNFSRDKLVNDADMLAALENGKIKYYVTDFPNDTVIGKPGVISLPHLGASTEEAEDNCATMATLQIMDYIENGNITNSVNYPACSMGAKTGTRICVIAKNADDMLQKLTAALTDVSIANMTSASRGDYMYALFDAAGDVDEAAVKAALEGAGAIRVRVL